MNLTDYIPHLAVLLVILVLIWRFGEVAKPIVGAVVGGLTKQAATNSSTFAIAIGFGLAASCSAFIDVFQALTREQAVALSGHQYAVLWVKVFNPFVVSVLAYATQSKINGAKAPNGTTQPPFPTSSS